jgi:phenylpropionate dioxygenase-like ring-hydroxylating dioxygenase large terminal subunit
MSEESLDNLISRRRPGFSLESAFYNSAVVFSRDMGCVVSREWHLFGHESQIPNVGDYELFEIGGESLIVVRAGEAEIRALHNVCRHRGSRLAEKMSGHAQRWVCPYHAWTYALDGRLLSARNMQDTFDKAQYPLHEASIAGVEGLIFVSLVKDPGPLAFVESCIPYLQYYGVTCTKAAVRQTFEIPANWKLVIENFLECYHCALTHPEYMSVNTVAFVNDVRSAARISHSTEVRVELNAFDPEFPKGELPVERDQIALMLRKSLRKGYQTGSRDGKGVAPLLGSLKVYDGLSTVCIFNPFSWMSLYNDHCVIFRITPRDALRTDMEAIWLVQEDAVRDVDYSDESLTWLWRATLEQDKRLVVSNQRGTQSGAYRPGPYSLQEDMTEGFIAWYLGRIAAHGGRAHNQANARECL